jgi:hypothetical protein
VVFFLHCRCHEERGHWQQHHHIIIIIIIIIIVIIVIIIIIIIIITITIPILLTPLPPSPQVTPCSESSLLQIVATRPVATAIDGACNNQIITNTYEDHHHHHHHHHHHPHPPHPPPHLRGRR